MMKDIVWKPKDGDEEEVKVNYVNAAADYEASCDAIRLQVCSTSTEYKDVAEYVKELITVKDFSDKKAKRQKLMNREDGIQKPLRNYLL